MAYKSNDVQSTTKFTGKVFDNQVAQADQKDYMQVTKGKRELRFIETMDGDVTEDRHAGGPAPLPWSAR